MVLPMIDIQLVKVVRNGQTYLVGKRFQDRWNLQSLGFRRYQLEYTRNGNDIKKARRMVGWMGFTLSTVKGDMVDATQAETNLLSDALANFAA